VNKATVNVVGDEFYAAVEQVLEDAMEAGAVRIQSAVQDTMPGEGAKSIKGPGNRLRHIPSTPGQPPGVRLNRLRPSIAIERTRLRRRIGTNVKYARIQEFGGTVNNPGGTPYIVTDKGAVFISKKKADELEADGKTVKRTKPSKATLPPRPFMQPGYEAARDPAIKAITRAFERGMEGVRGL
jgi:phage gpG-like protein